MVLQAVAIRELASLVSDVVVERLAMFRVVLPLTRETDEDPKLRRILGVVLRHLAPYSRRALVWLNVPPQNLLGNCNRCGRVILSHWAGPLADSPPVGTST